MKNPVKRVSSIECVEEVVHHVKNNESPKTVLVITKDFEAGQTLIIETLSAMSLAQIQNISRSRLARIHVLDYEIIYTPENTASELMRRFPEERLELWVDSAALKQEENKDASSESKEE